MILAESADVLEGNLTSLFIIIVIATLVPIAVGLFRIKITEVVLLIGFGVLVGPYVLNVVEIDSAISLLSEIGLGFLFFMAGMELDRRVLKGTTGKLAGIGWIVSLAIGLSVSGVMFLTGIVHDWLGIAIALTSTALGTLLPLVRDSGRLRTKFGANFMAAGAWGEFGPIFAISLLLSSVSAFAAIVTIIVFGIIALLVAFAPKWLGTAKVREILDKGHETSAQTAIRLTILVLIGLLALADHFGLDTVLGAFVAGIIVGQYAPSEKGKTQLHHKIEGIAFGLFIPLFFVVTGAKLDLPSIIENPGKLVGFFFLLLLVRGVPQFFIYWREFPRARERIEFALFAATALPIVVAVTTIEVNAGVMLSANAAALVGAAAVSVLVFPLVGSLVNKSASVSEVLNA